VGQCAVLTNLCSLLNQLQPTRPGARRASRGYSQTALLDQGRNVAEYLAVLLTGRTRCGVLGVESSVCWIYGWTRRLTVPAGACTQHVHCGEAQGDTMEACVHRMLYLGCTI
jgi:hypothetical protein